MDGADRVSTESALDNAIAPSWREALIPRLSGAIGSVDRAGITQGLLRTTADSGAFVLESDLQIDAVLHDLVFLDDCGRLHDFDRLDVPNRTRRGHHGLPRGVRPRPRAGPDHLANDDHAH